MPLFADITGGTSVGFKFDLEWLLAVMSESSRSMVPFTFFTGQEPPKEAQERSYPRSVKSDFTLGLQSKTLFPGAKIETASSPSDGGRKTASSVPYGLCKLLGDDNRKIPLSDIALLFKRAVGRAVKKSNLKNLNVMAATGLEHNSLSGPGFSTYDYPMLCIMGKEMNNKFPRDQSEWRVVQCVFGAVLTQQLRAYKIGVEVVSREGFGSLFPTLSDLSLPDQPSGIRLDPGLLPPKEGAEAICAALLVIDKLIAINPTLNTLKSVQALGGLNSGALRQVDNLMSWLHDFAQAKPGANAQDYLQRVSDFSGKSGSKALPIPENLVVSCVLDGIDIPGDIKKLALLKPKPRTKPRPKQVSNDNSQKLEQVDEDLDDGYGSESDYEDEDGGKEKLIIPEKKPPLAFRKFSVVTGMAALRIATLYAMAYSSALFSFGWNKGTQLKDAEVVDNSILTWAPYFELELDNLHSLFPKKEKVGIKVLLFDGAPNPVNIPDKGLGQIPKGLGAIVIDATNLTSWEKARYAKDLFPLLASPAGENGKGLGGVIVLVDSVSKQPTGGDLVHGVLRVFGLSQSVNAFHQGFLLTHLKLNSSMARGQTVLNETETEVRRMMKELRLVPRNLDIVQWLHFFK